MSKLIAPYVQKKLSTSKANKTVDTCIQPRKIKIQKCSTWITIIFRNKGEVQCPLQLVLITVGKLKLKKHIVEQTEYNIVHK